MRKEFNPFVSVGYVSKDYFCDREYEQKVLRSNIENSQNTVLISMRRLGKSALIYRLFESLERKKYICLYVDMFATQSLKDFIEALSAAIFRRFPPKKSWGTKFLDFIKNFRPVLSYDSLTGQPEVHFEFAQASEYSHTLQSLLQFLDAQDHPVALAIDEFQQLAYYPETNAEAVLRTIIQTLKNTSFIFSGSKKHLMLEMFNTAKRPFFSSAQMLGLSEISDEKYRLFIRKKMEDNARKIDPDALDFILAWTLRHTYYTQAVCNSVFACAEKHITLDVAKQVCSEQLDQQQQTYIQYRNLLSPIQWRLLIAIAKEEKVAELQAQKFLRKYQLSASSTKKALDALLEKEMVCTIDETSKTYYRVYNVFLLRWLERHY
jgi:hypothetical protein